MTLKEAREGLKISQLKLDRTAKLPSGTTFDLESGRVHNPSHQTVIKITRALQRLGLPGVTGEQLFPVQDEQAAAS